MCHCFAVKTGDALILTFIERRSTMDIFISQSAMANCVQVTDCPNVNIEPCVSVTNFSNGLWRLFRKLHHMTNILANKIYSYKRTIAI